MEYASIGGAIIKASRVCMGTWAIGGWLWGGSDESDSVAAIQTALQKGLNFIDTAPAYGFGLSEVIVGKAVSGIDRTKVFISTKAGIEWREGRIFRNASRERILTEIDDSLRRLKTGYIDLYHVHWPDPLVPVEETAQVMNELLKQGKIRAIGVSNFSVEQMEEFRKVAPIHACQSPYNLFEREIESDILPYCKEHGIVVLAYGALCRGLLSGRMRPDAVFVGDDLRNKDPKFRQPLFGNYLKAVDELASLARARYQKSVLQMAVRWVLDQGAEFALWGVRNPGQLEPLDGIMGWSLDENAMREIDGILKRNIPKPVGPEFMAPPSRELATKAF
ncbi:MAG: aldo/keto reductase [Nitrospiraceae bacterium]|nr:aldo/keto reductase [Nitrospiraceae bacterium]